jgi:cyclopropane fatty-acyl-phospholipid synthase-like methyltransferase
MRLLRRKPTSRHGLVGQARLWEMKRNFQIRFLRSQGLRPEHRLLDVGCGTLRGGLPLIDYLHAEHYTGVEVRANVLAEGRQELAEAGLEHKRPALIHADDLSDLSLGEFDYVWAFSVLIHMSNDIATGCLRFVENHLAPGGVFFANVNIGERRDERWQGFPIVWRPWSFYDDLARQNGLAVTSMGALETLGHVSGARADAQPMLRFVEPAMRH